MPRHMDVQRFCEPLIAVRDRGCVEQDEVWQHDAGRLAMRHAKCPAELVAKGVTALSARGEAYTAANVRERLSLRDWAMEARESGIIAGGGPPPLNEKALRTFANAFDAWLSRAQKATAAPKAP